MKTCVVGAGAIGGFLAARLAHAGNPVSVVVRGAHLAAIKAKGLTLVDVDGKRIVTRVEASDDVSALGSFELVILALKAHQLPALASTLPRLFDDKTIVVSMQNGVPWWYFQGMPGPYLDRPIESVDPGGGLIGAIDAHRVIGSIAYPACVIEEPGVIRQIEGNRFPLGEINGEVTPRVRAVAELFRAAGFKTPVLSDIRAEIWLKLWGNVSFNPISALTRATLSDICEDPPVRDLARAMMLEAQSVASALGVAMKVDVERRIDGAQKIGAHKTSMLQDVEAGRPLEIDALMKSVIELGRLSSTPTPLIEEIFSLTSLLARTLQSDRDRTLSRSSP
jgi:2-dehydropantoate 2-reductase